jgi:hypothetical protein
MVTMDIQSDCYSPQESFCKWLACHSPPRQTKGNTPQNGDPSAMSGAHPGPEIMCHLCHFCSLPE